MGTPYVKVCKTYDLDPTKFYTDERAWEQYDQDVQDDGTGGEAGSSTDGTGGAVVVPSLFGVTPVFDFGSKTEAKASAEEQSKGAGAEGDAAKPAEMPSGECKT